MGCSLARWVYDPTRACQMIGLAGMDNYGKKSKTLSESATLYDTFGVCNQNMPLHVR